jgi:peptidyl-prolyl cis-trans isomerase C
MIRPALLSLLALGLAAQTPAPAPKAEPKPAAAAPAPAAKPAPAPAQATPAAKVEGKPAPAPAQAAPAAKVEGKPAAAPAAPKVDKVIGRVDGVAIHESEMDVMFANLNPQQKQQIAAQGRDKMVQNYLEFRLLSAKARREGVEKTDSYKQKAAFALHQVLAMEYLGKQGAALQAKAVPTEDQLKAYFESHKDAFKTQGKFSARHILVKTKGGPNGESGLSEEDAKKKAAEILAEFAKGGKWDDLAKKYSEDPGSKDKGGLYEGIVFGQFVPEFEVAVKKQEIGKLGEPVKSMFGYHLIQVESRDEAATPEYEKVKDQVKQRAGSEAQEKVWKDMIEGIKKEVAFVSGDEAQKDAPKEPAKDAPKAAPKAPKAKAAPKKAEAGK